jgi:spore cortex formation protein SpoVR/YcgB (stage V sporulation)
MFRDIRRICENPTAEDKEWFPGFAGSDWLETCLHAVESYRDESFIKQFLSPTLMRKMRLFSLNNNTNSNQYEVKNIHNGVGYKGIRETLSNMYNISNLIPDIEIADADFTASRTLTLRHNVVNNKLLDRNTDEMLKHIKRLWGYTVKLESIDTSDDKVLRAYQTNTLPTLEI